MSTGTRYAPELRERAVRMVFEHADAHTSQWAAIQSIAGKLGCSAEVKRTGFLGDLISWEDGVYGTSKSVFAGGA